MEIMHSKSAINLIKYQLDSSVSMVRLAIAITKGDMQMPIWKFGKENYIIAFQSYFSEFCNDTIERVVHPNIGDCFSFFGVYFKVDEYGFVPIDALYTQEEAFSCFKLHVKDLEINDVVPLKLSLKEAIIPCWGITIKEFVMVRPIFTNKCSDELEDAIFQFARLGDIFIENKYVYVLRQINDRFCYTDALVTNRSY